MNSEEILNICDPSDYQCHAIDCMIQKLQESIKFSTQAMVALDPHTIIQANKEVCVRIEGLDDKLEEFRVAIEDTRNWGCQWKRLAKDLLNKYEPHRLNPLIDFDDDIPF